MAVMIPEQIPTDSDVTGSERDFFDQLDEMLSDEFYVYWSTPYIEGDRARQGEADFIVLHPHYGMLIIEVKGGGVRREGSQWYRGHDKMPKSPIEQAAAQKNDLAGKFGRQWRSIEPGAHGFPMVYGFSLAFPYTALSDVNMPPEFEREMVIAAEDMAELGRKVTEAFEFHRRRWNDRRSDPPSMDDADFHRFRKQVVSPDLDFAPNLAGRAAADERQLVKLSRAQTRVVRQLLASDRVRIPGGAGTGKTVLALHAARRLADQGADVLLICFNKYLRYHLRDQVDSFELAGGGSIEPTSFHSMCWHAARAIDRPLDVPTDEEAAGDYWIHEAPLRLLEALEAGAVGPYDAIIVDEGQDFAEPWWEVLEMLLRDGGKMAIFYDDAQSIFDHGSCVPEFPAKFPLFENFRNTKAITDPVRRLGDVDMESHPDCPAGEEPIIYQQPGPTKTRRQVDGLVRDLLAKHRFRPEQIVVLTPHKPKNSSLGELETLGDAPVVRDIHQREEDAILHTTIGAFKGLESPVIIMVDIDPDDPRCGRHERYVAASRARLRLYVFEKGHWLDD